MPPTDNNLKWDIAIYGISATDDKGNRIDPERITKDENDNYTIDDYLIKAKEQALNLYQQEDYNPTPTCITIIAWCIGIALIITLAWLLFF